MQATARDARLPYGRSEPPAKRQGRVPIYLLARRRGLAGDAGVAAVGAVGHGSCLWFPGPPWLPLKLWCAWLPSFSLDSPLPWSARWVLALPSLEARCPPALCSAASSASPL